jgi:1,4-dihydroxy-2-naphthoate octaprenyltransferase
MMSAESPRDARVQARVWLVETRPMFLLGSVVLAFLGISVASSYGFFNASHAAVAFIGLILWHISVQVLNDYYDYKAGTDL